MYFGMLCTSFTGTYFADQAAWLVVVMRLAGDRIELLLDILPAPSWLFIRVVAAVVAAENPG